MIAFFDKYFLPTLLIGASLPFIALYFAFSASKKQSSGNIKVEYELEIIDQNTVKVRATDSGKIYFVPFDKVENALIKDNL